MSEETTETSSNSLYPQHVEAIINRSREAWDDLLGAYSARLRRDVHMSVHKWGLPPELGEDIEQETWLRALRGIKNFVWEDDENFYRWLRVTSKNITHELHRSADRTVSLEDVAQAQSDTDMDDLFAKYGLSDGNVEDQVILRERMVALESALKTLKAEEREIYLLWAMGEKPKILAAKYGKKANTISHMVKRTTEKIQAILSANYKDNDHE